MQLGGFGAARASIGRAVGLPPAHLRRSEQHVHLRFSGLGKAMRPAGVPADRAREAHFPSCDLQRCSIFLFFAAPAPPGWRAMAAGHIHVSVAPPRLPLSGGRGDRQSSIARRCSRLAARLFVFRQHDVNQRGGPFRPSSTGLAIAHRLANEWVTLRCSSTVAWRAIVMCAWVPRSSRFNGRGAQRQGLIV